MKNNNPVILVLKNIYTFASDNFMFLALTIFITSLVGYFLRYTYKSIRAKKNEFDLENFLKSQIIDNGIFSVVLSIVIFSISTLWVEYPKGKVLWVNKTGDKWVKHESRVLHIPFKFNGYAVKKGGFSDSVSLSENSPFMVQYHVTEENIPTVLNTIKHSKKNKDSCGCGLSVETGSRELIKAKSYKLFFSNPMESLIDDATRKKIFKEYYAPYGITIDSVDFP